MMNVVYFAVGLVKLMFVLMIMVGVLVIFLKKTTIGRTILFILYTIRSGFRLMYNISKKMYETVQKMNAKYENPEKKEASQGKTKKNNVVDFKTAKANK